MNSQTTYPSSQIGIAESCQPGSGGLKARQIECESNRLSEAINHLRTAIERLDKRLEPVMSSIPVCSKEGGTPDPILAPLAGRIRDWKQEVAKLIAYIDGLHDRIEL